MDTLDDLIEEASEPVPADEFMADPALGFALLAEQEEEYA